MSSDWTLVPPSLLRPELVRHAWGDADDPDAVVDAFFGVLEVYARDGESTRAALAEFFGRTPPPGQLNEREQDEIRGRLASLPMVGARMSHGRDETTWAWAGGLRVTVSHLTGVTSLAFEACASVTSIEVAQAQLRLAEARRAVDLSIAFATEDF